MSPEIDVLVLGGAGVDTIVSVPQLPLPFADSYLVPAVETRAGQTGDFISLGLHALGLRVHHIDLVGDDHHGDLVRALHRDRGIPLTTAPMPSGTRRAVNLVGPDGRRMSLYDQTRGGGDGPLPPDTVRSLAKASRHAHVSITYPCGLALPALRREGLTISTDLHNWDGANPYHETFAFDADVVFVSVAALADPERTMRRIVELGRARIVVATAGADGAYLLTGGELTHVAVATPPAPVVDSNGAGDAFAAGFLFGWLAGEPPLRCAAYGAVAGAYACTVPATVVDAIGREALLAAAGDGAAAGDARGER
ncbi:adenosine kinase [Dactylosporangium aurantiacum]|uniref:Adenosine kinase n=1 Tax=Dactylosporangium aurantiacum TaxID=35754 RepID=A0A9Q9IPH3_9ACTN|nr:adenosine kinase [Dactylosporangium aurantiacum]MDG6102974.1 adenosine kinase [Dactylosporangium aurantiacum]UWZ57487.1 adenosine kinase [Dactylosporangium aurantiacum]